MKKFITFAAVAAFATMASATTLNWGYGDAYLYVSVDGAPAAQITNGGAVIPAGAQMRLIYLGSATTYDILDVTDAMVIDSYDVASTFDDYDDYMNPGMKTIEIAENGVKETLAGGTVTTKSNDNFGVVFWDGDSYEYVYGVTDYDNGTLGDPLKEVVSIGDIKPTSNPVNLSASYPAPKDEWEIRMAAVMHTTPIPEPATAALALLGIGMMFRRRRA